ncbi:MAG: tRNA preQ1(34) S-adenosylmethionine ribosyltransferase-isomerase QueA [Elusimicrobiota bacterium]|jgi:S-adenosylmethionine:tRNA ribosyltransferase-isomerase|nr:tRNA preQ1(34) S-adenosylmethionine ribosyltransferase-isomerase QueA [Elusimicrobiota bacterium]
MNKTDELLSNYDYEIPKELIAQRPCGNRSDSRLFVLDREKNTFSHKKFSDIDEFFSEGDCLVINNAKVVASRIFGKKETGGKVEILLTNPLLNSKEYKALIKPRIKIGKKIIFKDGYECLIKSQDENGEVLLEFNKSEVLEFMEKFGLMPLPPYINRKDGLGAEMSDFDKERYQTIYAKERGAIAAPTAGLHFTTTVLDNLIKKGVKIACLTLYVGWGTFKPILSENINEHKMMSESFLIDKKNVEIINSTIREKKKITAVGTTSARALESAAKKTGYTDGGFFQIKEFEGKTDIFIRPGYKFNIVNRLITNFHLPKSTPLMMASAFSSRKQILSAYKEAVKEKYRFFSYGDAMIIL